MSESPRFVGVTSSGDLDERYHQIVESIRPVADVVEARPFSGLLLSLTLEIDPGRLGALRDALAGVGVAIDDVARAAFEAAHPSGGRSTMMLSIRFSEGSADTRRVVPRVPG